LTQNEPLGTVTDEPEFRTFKARQANLLVRKQEYFGKGKDIMEEFASPDHAETGTAVAAVLQLTETAAEMVKVSMQRESLTDYALRVSVVGGGCSGLQYSLNFDNVVHDDDAVVEQYGVRLVVDATSAPHLAGTTIDYVKGLHGAGFKFINPKAARTCGCGSSFST
jgi:iron-sulfur cluster assembly accessory protein